MKEIKIETIVLWYEHKIVGIHVNGDMVWEKPDVVVTETGLMETCVVLPIVETIEYAATLLNGIAAERLVILLNVLEKKLDELRLLGASLDLREAANALKNTKDDCDGRCANCDVHCDNTEYDGDEEWDDEDE